jgi:hypothetical protein
LMEGTLDVDADDVGDVLIGRNFSLVPSCWMSENLFLFK